MISKNQIKFIRSLELKKNRKQNGLFVAEGPKVVGGLPPNHIPGQNSSRTTSCNVSVSCSTLRKSLPSSRCQLSTLNPQLSTLNPFPSKARLPVAFQLSTLNYLSLSTAFRIQAISARLSALPTGLAFPPSTVHRKRLMSIILKWFKQQWAVWPMCK